MKLIEGIDYGLDVSHDGKTVWVTGPDGSSVGRFSKVFGMDVHRTCTEQMAGAGECLYCTHAPAGQKEWDEFRSQVRTHYGIEIPSNAIRFEDAAQPNRLFG